MFVDDILTNEENNNPNLGMCYEKNITDENRYHFKFVCNPDNFMIFKYEPATVPDPNYDD